MSAEMRVEPDVLIESARGVDTASAEVGRLVSGLCTSVTTGNPWGDDDPGTIFGTAYLALLGHALEVYESHVGGLGFARDGLITWAESVTSADEAGAYEYGSVRVALGGS